MIPNIQIIRDKGEWYCIHDISVRSSWMGKILSESMEWTGCIFRLYVSHAITRGMYSTIVHVCSCKRGRPNASYTYIPCTHNR